MSGIAHLAATIAAHLRAWDASPAFVELAVYASADPIVIAETINAFCLRVLGTPHSKLFDFPASSSGAEWIDEIALFARQREKFGTFQNLVWAEGTNLLDW